MKKLISTILLLVLMLSLAACSGKESDEPVLTAEDGREVINFAASSPLPNEIMMAIEGFNNSSDKYFVEFIDYSEFNTEEDFTAGKTKLLTEITTGKTPDLMNVAYMRLDDFIAKGMFADLFSFLDDENSSLRRDDLMPGFLNALSTGDKLYTVSPSFVLTSLYGLESTIGDRESWNAKELCDFIEANPEVDFPFINMGAQMILQSLVMYSVDDFVDAESGECSFDSNEFVELLEAINAASQKTSSEYLEAQEELKKGTGLLANAYLSAATQYANLDNQLGGDVKFIGYPTSEGRGHIASCFTSIAMFENSQVKEGAWAFLEYLFSEENQDSYMGIEVPLLKSSFEKSLEGSEEQPVTPEQKEEYIALINSVDKVANLDATIMDIITEEAMPFFEGSISANEAAEIIQNRVSILVAEGK